MRITLHAVLSSLTDTTGHSGQTVIAAPRPVFFPNPLPSQHLPNSPKAIAPLWSHLSAVTHWGCSHVDSAAERWWLHTGRSSALGWQSCHGLRLKLLPPFKPLKKASCSIRQQRKVSQPWSTANQFPKTSLIIQEGGSASQTMWRGETARYNFTQWSPKYPPVVSGTMIINEISNKSKQSFSCHNQLFR